MQHFPDWRSKMTILVQLSRKKHPAIPDIPLVFDFIRSEFVVNGLSVEEWLRAAEYIFTGGNTQVVLCARGVASFDTSLSFALDYGAIAAVTLSLRSTP